MESWFLQPVSDQLSLSDNHWVLVRRRLNAGEHRAHLKRSSHENGDGTRHIDVLDHGLSIVVSYLLDWSLVDTSGHPIALRDSSGRPLDPDALVAIVDNLDPDRFIEIKTAIQAHIDAQEAARAAEKKTGGTLTPAPISPSRSAVDGVSTGSVN
jgi:hypothetical protein